MNHGPRWQIAVIGILSGFLLVASFLIGVLYNNKTVVVEQVVASVEEERQSAIVTATKAVAPAVVSINVIDHRTVVRSSAPRGMEYWERFFPGMFPRREFQQDIQSMGSGVIVSTDGYVITNVHVIENADEIMVTLNDGRQFEATLLEQVKGWDLALLKIEADNLPVAKFANSESELQIGQWAIAIGSPFGYLLADTQPTVTVGVISALNRDIKQQQNGQTFLGMIQTDASINPGNSGGPLINSDGEIIGINTFIFTGSGGSIGIGFAVPATRAKWIVDEVRQFGRYRQAWTGVMMQLLSPKLITALELDENIAGFIVREIEAGSPAEKAGLKVYDVITAIDGVPLTDKDTVDRLVYEAKVGRELRYTVVRKDKIVTGKIVLEEFPR
ncbi:MAG: trypsin-like serine protease [bacterium]|nr:trypsin-like serine protease [bacterium]